MINEEKRKQFLTIEDALMAKKALLEKRISAISTGRAISFVAGAALFFVGIGDGKRWALILGIIALAIFVTLVMYHAKAYKSLDMTKSRLDVCGSYLKRFDGTWIEFPDNGEEYLDKDDMADTVAMDLDLLGRTSLYQMINTAHTDEGRERLADSLKLKKLNPLTSKEKSQAIGELMEKTEFAIEFQANGILLEKNKKRGDLGKLKQYCNPEAGGKNSDGKAKGDIPGWINVIRIGAPMVLILTIILCLAKVVVYIVPLICFLAILLFSWLTGRIKDIAIAPLYGINYCIDDYVGMMQCISEEQFEASYLKRIRENISGNRGAMEAFGKLRFLCQTYNIRFNPILHLILNKGLLWDYHLAYYMGKWRKKYGKCVADAFESIGMLEELLSFCVIGQVRKTGWGHINYEDKEKVSLEGKSLYHPLINPENVVANSCKLTSGITIITGSNMSGKTTFLRTLAVNLVLAYIGAPICGEKLEADYMKMFTSMRITDDVANGISTFYAEILRIKAMAEYRKENKPMLCLIDEIFKGTNSADRIVGAAEAIQRLSSEKCMTIVSTHDFELCEISDNQGKQAVNYHFEEHYNNGELSFDYTIKDGKCTTTNARELLKLAGFFSENQKE